MIDIQVSPDHNGANILEIAVEFPPDAPARAHPAEEPPPDDMRRTAFFTSDSTGITAETLGQAMLAQFDNLELRRVVLAYVDTADKARSAAARIDQAAAEDGKPPILFHTIVNQQVRGIIAASKGRSEEHTSELQSRGHLVCRL